MDLVACSNCYNYACLYLPVVNVRIIVIVITLLIYMYLINEAYSIFKNLLACSNCYNY